MRHCPFCNSYRLKVVHKLRTKFNLIKTARLSAYVRCLNCNARGPLVVGIEEYDVRYQRPSKAAKQAIAEEASKKWENEPIDPNNFKLEA